MNFKCSKLFAEFTWVLLGWGWAVWIEVWQVPVGSASVSGSGTWKWGSTASEPTFCQASDNRATAYVAWLPVQGGHDRKFVVYFKRVSTEDKRDEWQWSRLPTLTLWIGFLVSQLTGCKTTCRTASVCSSMRWRHLCAIWSKSSCSAFASFSSAWLKEDFATVDHSEIFSPQGQGSPSQKMHLVSVAAGLFCPCN